MRRCLRLRLRRPPGRREEPRQSQSDVHFLARRQTEIEEIQVRGDGGVAEGVQPLVHVAVDARREQDLARDLHVGAPGRLDLAPGLGVHPPDLGDRLVQRGPVLGRRFVVFRNKQEVMVRDNLSEIRTKIREAEKARMPRCCRATIELEHLPAAAEGEEA